MVTTETTEMKTFAHVRARASIRQIWLLPFPFIDQLLHLLYDLKIIDWFHNSNIITEHCMQF